MKTRKKQFLCGFLIAALTMSTVIFPVQNSTAEDSGSTAVYNGQFAYGDFEGSIEEIKTHWTTWNTCFEFSNADNHTPGGSQCLAVNPESPWQALGYVDDSGNAGIEIIPNAIYRISFWHKGAANGQFEIGEWGWPSGVMTTNIDEEWTYYYRDFNPLSRTRISQLTLKSTQSSTDTSDVSYFDDIKIEMITVPATAKPSEPLTVDETLAGKHETMEIGTNFWFNVDWSGCTPMKENINWETAYKNGDDIWNETFVSELAPFTTLRFMDWNNTNGSKIVEWSERRLPNDPGNAQSSVDPNNPAGLAYEWMIDLCNRNDKNAWICIPAQASDDYIYKLAQLCKEKLESGLKLYIEYSNEVWNSSFPQYQYCEAMGQKTTEIGLTEENKFTDNHNANYYVYRSFQIFNIFEEIYGYEEMGKTCIRICASSANLFLFDIAYEKVFYNKEDYNPNDQRADYFAVAPYVGIPDGYDINAKSQFHEAINTVLDSYVKTCYNLGKKYGLPLVAYEGGQHLTSGAHIWSENPEIYNQYIYMLNQYAPYFELFCHYTLTGSWSSGGAWGANAYTGQPLKDAHKLRALYDWIKAPTTPYESTTFPEGAPSSASFQNGLDGWITNGVDGSYEVITNSTAEEDANHPHYLSFRCTNHDNAGRYFETAFRLEPGETYDIQYDLASINTDSDAQNPSPFYIQVALLDYTTNQALTSLNWAGVQWGTYWQSNITIPETSEGLVKLRFNLYGDGTGNCNMLAKFDNLKVFKNGEAAPVDPQEPTGSYTYQRKPLAAITPIPRVTPTPEITPTPVATPIPTTNPPVEESPSDSTNGNAPTNTPDLSGASSTTPNATATTTPSAGATDQIQETVLKVKKIKFKKKNVKMKVGKKKVLRVKLNPVAKKLTKPAKKVKWSINKKGRKVVKFVKKAKKLRGKFKAKIKAKKKGRAKVMCKAPSGKKAKCRIIVK